MKSNDSMETKMTIIHHEPETGKFPKGTIFAFFGRPKIGKSTFAASWDKPLIFDLESGYQEISADIIIPKNYEEFIRELRNKKNLNPYETIVIDSFDVVYNWAEENAIASLNKSFKTAYTIISDFPHGSGWGVSRNNIKRFILNDLFNIIRTGRNVVLILHEKSETIKRNNKESTIFKIALPGQSSNLVASLASVVGRIYSKEIAGKFEPRISFIAGIDDGGSRIKSLAGKTIPLDFKVLKSVIESSPPPKKPKKLTDIAKENPKNDDDEW